MKLKLGILAALVLGCTFIFACIPNNSESGMVSVKVDYLEQGTEEATLRIVQKNEKSNRMLYCDICVGIKGTAKSGVGCEKPSIKLKDDESVELGKSITVTLKENDFIENQLNGDDSLLTENGYTVLAYCYGSGIGPYGDSKEVAYTGNGGGTTGGGGGTTGGGGGTTGGGGGTTGGGGGTPPTDPAGINAFVVGPQVNLTWTDFSMDETGFTIERAEDNFGTPGVFGQIATVGANITTYSDTTGSSGTDYWYQVKARNTYGDSGYSTTASSVLYP